MGKKKERKKKKAQSHGCDPGAEGCRYGYMIYYVEFTSIYFQQPFPCRKRK